MSTILIRSWKQDFERAAANEREELLYRERMKRFEAQQRERQAEQHVEEVKREQSALAAFQAAFAPSEAVIEFRHQMDAYDTATVEALMEKQEAFKRIEKEMERVLSKAHALPDGRRVFKSEDGQRVFDEYGKELSHDEIDPNVIDDRKMRWEPYKSTLFDKHKRLSQDIDELYSYQAELDRARERLNNGEITNGELEKLKDGLADSMPEAVRVKLGHDKPKPEVEHQLSETAPTMPNGMDDLMKNTGLGQPGKPAFGPNPS